MKEHEATGSIRLLPSGLRSQIAAGEVVERPASVLKELVENSLDAGATSIDATLENGGASLILVQDNGNGIREEDLPLAVARHATSKLRAFADLEHISSFGFRGEALASIASVSRLRIVSAHAGASCGASLTVEHGRIISSSPDPLPRGTRIEVRDLFGNVPARLKFLKSPATEFKSAQAWLFRLALSRPDVAFSLRSGQRQAMTFAQGQDLSVRLGQLWPQGVVDAMLPISHETCGARVSGLAGRPELRQPRSDRILLYVNGRAVNDKRLLAAVRQAYRGRIISGDYPQAVLFLELDPAHVDVNVHPAKTEVRFRDESAVFAAVSGALKKALDASSPLSACGSQEAPDGFWGSLDDLNSGRSVSAGFPVHEPVCRAGNADQPAARERAARTAQEIHTRTTRDESWPEPAYYNTYNTQQKAEHALMEDAAPFENETGARAARTESAHAETLRPEAVPESMAEKNLRCRDLVYLGQVADTYLVLRDDAGALLLLDQHAAHERVLFNSFLRGGLDGDGQLQALPLEMTPGAAEMERFFELRQELEKFGYRFQLRGETLLAISLPPLLTRSEARDFLREALSGQKDAPDGMLLSMACKRAIKAGQKLAVDEALELLRLWRDTHDAANCPHGRPCVLRWDNAALEKLFKRRT